VGQLVQKKEFFENEEISITNAYFNQLLQNYDIMTWKITLEFFSSNAAVKT